MRVIAILEVPIVERLAQDNYSPVYDFLPNPHAFYPRGWTSKATVLDRCKDLTDYRADKGLSFHNLAAGVPKEARMGPMFAAYLDAVTR